MDSLYVSLHGNQDSSTFLYTIVGIVIGALLSLGSSTFLSWWQNRLGKKAEIETIKFENKLEAFKLLAKRAQELEQVYNFSYLKLKNKGIVGDKVPLNERKRRLYNDYTQNKAFIAQDDCNDIETMIRSAESYMAWMEPFHDGSKITGSIDIEEVTEIDTFMNAFCHFIEPKK